MRHGSLATPLRVFSRDRTKWLVAALAFSVPLAFAWFTQHAWEDYFITLRSSRNLVEGHGLVFNPGERVHTFTSPLGVLIPAFCTVLVGVQHEQLALWIFRAISAALLAGGAAILWHRTTALGLRAAGRWVLFGLLLADAKLNDFSINGMETALLIFFTVLLWSELEAGESPRPWWIAVACAGLMWTRPDAFVLAGALILPHLLTRKRPVAAPRPFWRSLGGGILLGGLLYLPWFAWAWWYYGSPIPHTVIAKAAFTPPIQIRELLLQPVLGLTGFSLLDDLFLPSYWIFGGWPRLLNVVAHVLAVVAAFAWVVPQLSGVARRLSLAVFLGMFYLCSIILFPWYVPPWTVLACLAIAFAVDQSYASAFLVRRRYLAVALRMAVLFVLLVQAATFAGVGWQMRIHQRYVETGVRRDLGEWLRQNAAPRDTLFLEPLGYIGYFSGLKTYDFPGLSSPEVVAALRHGARNYAGLIERLQPRWVVLRPSEAARAEFKTKPVLGDYELVKSWDATPKLDTVRFLPGRAWVEAEAAYHVYRRKPPAP